MVTITLVDDHILVCHAISQMIQLSKKNYKVISLACNGKNFIQQIEQGIIPQIAFIDIQMPVMDGFTTTRYLHEHYPSIKIIGLSAMFDETTIKQMRQAGAIGFISKSAEPNEFWEIIDTVAAGSSYSPCYLKANYLFDSTINETIHINDREKEFLSLCTSELTYKEIAEKMNVKTRTVDNYRDSLFEKLNVVSRTGLVLYAIKNKIVKL